MRVPLHRPSYPSTPHLPSHSPYLSILEEEHDGVNWVVPDPQTGQQDPVQVKLEDGDRDMHKQLVRTGFGGDVRVDSGCLWLSVCLGEQVSRVFNL